MPGNWWEDGATSYFLFMVCLLALYTKRQEPKCIVSKENPLNWFRGS